MNFMISFIKLLLLSLFAINVTLSFGVGQLQAAANLKEIITELSSYTDRSSGTEGSEQAAAYISDYFEQLGLEPRIYHFPIPVREVVSASLHFDNQTIPLPPLINNAVTPQAIDGFLEGPLYYVNQGNISDLDRKLIKDAILLMDFNSGRNWLTAASLGARAVIFVDRQATTSHSFFKEKEELSPIQFPCFWMEKDEALALFGPLSQANNGLIRDKVELRSAISWQNKTGKNIYCLIEGIDPELKEDLLIIEAFYDSTRHVYNHSPGADEAVSVANLLKLAEMLSYNP
ncbi:MAG: peptide ABC transporter permease, partial [Desulfobacterales bacterium]|nr:peptide ABC transporter permease [Desulfobacterales bacterium]